MKSAQWGIGLWDNSKWDVLVTDVHGNITEGPDVVAGLVEVINVISGDITERPDIVAGAITTINTAYGSITESPDVVYGYVNSGIAVSGNVIESPDIVSGFVKSPGRDLRHGWAPQFHYKREWEKEPEVVVEVEEVFEPDPEAVFIPTALPIDPAVARMIESMMRGPQPVDTDDDDLEAILMHL